MTIDYTTVNAGQQFVSLLPSAARTATPNQQQIAFNGDVDALVIVVNVTAVAATGSVTVDIEGVDTQSQGTYPILTATTTDVINTTNGVGTYAFKVAQSIPAAVSARGSSANDLVPPVVRVTLTHSAATSFTYSVTVLAPN